MVMTAEAGYFWQCVSWGTRTVAQLVREKACWEKKHMSVVTARIQCGYKGFVGLRYSLCFHLSLEMGEKHLKYLVIE